jgi:hypothetical protein
MKKIQVNDLQANEIANAAKAAKKYLAEISVAQKEYQKNTKKQKERNWFLYINQLEF